jgi:hypothetical protein
VAGVEAAVVARAAAPEEVEEAVEVEEGAVAQEV